MSETIEATRGPGRTATGSLAAQMARLFAKAIAEAIAPYELAPAQFLVLRELWKADGLTQTELARRLEVEQATMANTLKRMARDGLISRHPHPTDCRAQIVRATDRANALEKPTKAAVKQVNTLATATLSRKEQKRFAELSRQVIDSLKTGAASKDATPRTLSVDPAPPVPG